MKLTKIQWLTLIAIFAYLIYEFYFVARWQEGLPASDPVIRADLFFIIPVLAVLVIVSVYQIFRNKK